ncbi:MAG: dockerin type I domain-containing protein [Cyclonatronaceae bacterium]
MNDDPRMAGHSTVSIPLVVTSAVFKHAYTHSPENDGQSESSATGWFSEAASGGTLTDAHEAYVSPSGRFVIRYHPDGTHAVYQEDAGGTGTPDYVERAAAYADSSWSYMIGHLGFADPVLADTGPYEIILEKRGESIFGETVVNPGGQSTRTYVHPTFDGYPTNLDPEGSRYGALKVTIAHELKHASQYAGTGWQGDAGNIHWMELDAVMAENMVFPDVKDYYRNLNSVNSVFRDPKISVPVYPWQVTWMMYWAERMGPEFMAGVWDRLAAGESVIRAIKNGLASEGLSWREEVTRNYLWHLASGSYASVNEGFTDRFDYPTPSPLRVTDLLGRIDGPRFTYRSLSAGFQKFIPAEQDTGDVILFVMAADSLAGIGVYAFPGSETATPGSHIFLPDAFGRLLVTAGLRWEEVDTLGLVTVNTAESGDRGVHILAGNGKSIERLRYGDANLNGALNQVDVSMVLMSLTGASQKLTGFQRFTADVTGNGKVSVLDASMILRKLAGEPVVFPADLNEDGFGPEYALITRENSSPFAGLRGNSGELLSSLGFRLVAEETAEDLETELGIVVHNQDNDPFYSLLIRLLIPGSYLEVLPDLQPGEAFPGAMWSMNVSGDTVTVAIAGTGPVTDGKIAGIPLFALSEGTADLEILSVQVDEFTARPVTVADTAIIINKRQAVGLEPDDELPQKMTLHQNYPNPFNPGTMIRFDLPERAHISLRLYDTAGHLLATVADGFREAGRHELYLDASRMTLGSGVYLLVLQKGEQREVIKLTLIK